MGRRSSDVEKLPQYVSGFNDRHGKRRYFFRRKGQKPTYFKGHPGTRKHPSAEYKMIASGEVAANDARRAKPGTIDDLIYRYYGSSAFNGAGDDKRAANRGIIEAFRREHGAKGVATLKFQHVEAILLAKSRKRIDPNTGREVGGTTAAFTLRKQLKRIFDYAVKLEMIPTNPVSQSERIKLPKGGFHTWTEEEIAQYQERHPLGTKPRLALEIILWTLQRRGDVSQFGPQHIRGGKISYVQGKTGKELWLPVPPQLREAIDEMPAVGVRTFLVTEFGKPFSKAGLGNKMREWCDQAGLPQCSAHGLRKATGRRLAELGIGNQGIKASGGWSNDAEVAIYTAGADQARMADSAMTQLSAAHLSNHGSKVRQTDSSND
jgi:integrase